MHDVGNQGNSYIITEEHFTGAMYKSGCMNGQLQSDVPFANLSCNTDEDLQPQIPAMEKEMCLKAGTKGGARLALGISIPSSRCVTRCVLCFVENEAKLEYFPYASLQKVQKKKR